MLKTFLNPRGRRLSHQPRGVSLVDDIVEQVVVERFSTSKPNFRLSDPVSPRGRLGLFFWSTGCTKYIL